MILNSQVVEQSVDHEDRAFFVKQLLVARGTSPVALVRKRLARPRPHMSLESLIPDDVACPTRATVLMIHGYGQNRYAFHLPARSLVNHLARCGFDVYNIDLRGRGRSSLLGAKRPHSILDFVHSDVPTALDEIQAVSGRQPVYLVGHSLGGIVSYCVAVDEPQRVAGVISIGSPYHFTRGSRWLARAGDAFLAVDRVLHIPNMAVPASKVGRVVNVARRVWDSPLHPLPFRGFHHNTMEPEVLRQHMALAMDTGSISTIRAMFTWAAEARERANDNADGMFGYAGRFENLELPLLVISGKYDDLAPPASVKPAFEYSNSTDKTYREFPFGHIDLLVGKEAPRLTWPLVEAWLGRRADKGARTEILAGSA